MVRFQFFVAMQEATISKVRRLQAGFEVFVGLTMTDFLIRDHGRARSEFGYSGVLEVKHAFGP